MKKILIVSSNSHSLLYFRRELIESFLSRDIAVVLCCPEDKEFHTLHETFKDYNVAIVAIHMRNTSKNIFHDVKILINLISIIRKNKIDGIFLYHMKPIIYGSLAAKIRGIKNIYAMITGLGYVFTENNGQSAMGTLLKNLLSFSLSFNKKVFFQNRDDLEFLCRNKALKNRAVVINGSGVDVDFFKFTEPPKKTSFLFVGRLLKHKGIYEYLEAARTLKKKYPSLSFKVAGGFHSNPSAISKNELEKWIEEGIIEYLGDVRGMLPVFQEASVCVLPSYREGCPRSLLEAMSVGRAIITTDAPGCRDTVIENENGYLVPVKNIPYLLEMMEKFIEQPSLAKEMGYKSRLFAEEKYSVHKVNKIILESMGL